MSMKKTGVVLTVVLLFVVMHLFPEGQKEAAPAEPRKITFIGDNIINEDGGLNELIARYYELTGIELEVIKPPHQQYAEKLQVIATSGDLPDVWQVWPPLDYTFAMEGVNIALDEFVNESKNVKRFDKSAFMPYTFNDKIYGIPFNAGGGTVTYVRKDWLDRLGMAPPTTMEEFIEVARAFTFNDPDGNGKDDTVGYTSLVGGNSIDQNYWPNMFQGAMPGFRKINGKWVDGFTMPDMKEAIERIRKGYEEGWIDPEIFTNTTATARDKMAHGVAGMFSYWAGNWGKGMQDRTVAACGEEADVIALDAIEKGHYWNRVTVPECITVKAEDPKFVFDNFIDLKWDQGEVEFLFVHGAEGIHWKVEDGKYVKMPHPANPANTFGAAYIAPVMMILPLKNDPFELDPKIKDSEAKRLKKVVQYYIPAGGDVYAKNMGDLSALRAEVFSKIIAGYMSLDEGYEYYQQKATELQIDEIIKEISANE